MVLVVRQPGVGAAGQAQAHGPPQFTGAAAGDRLGGVQARAAGVVGDLRGAVAGVWAGPGNAVGEVVDLGAGDQSGRIVTGDQRDPRRLRLFPRDRAHRIGPGLGPAVVRPVAVRGVVAVGGQAAGRVRQGQPAPQAGTPVPGSPGRAGTLMQIGLRVRARRPCTVTARSFGPQARHGGRRAGGSRGRETFGDDVPGPGPWDVVESTASTGTLGLGVFGGSGVRRCRKGRGRPRAACEGERGRRWSRRPVRAVLGGPHAGAVGVARVAARSGGG